MKPPRPQMFLQRQNYRRRRLVDAVRLLPILGAILFVAPLLAIGVGAAGSTAKAGIYLFSSWAVLILAAVYLSRQITPQSDADSDADHDGAKPTADDPPL